jgi:hypothetical protein
MLQGGSWMLKLPAKTAFVNEAGLVAQERPNHEIGTKVDFETMSR